MEEGHEPSPYRQSQAPYLRLEDGHNVEQQALTDTSEDVEAVVMPLSSSYEELTSTRTHYAEPWHKYFKFNHLIIYF